MLTNETFAKLQEMHLGTMARQFKAQLDDPQLNIPSPLPTPDRGGLSRLAGRIDQGDRTG